jgi:hypothetical protein
VGDSQFFIYRSEDLLLLGVKWIGFEVVGEATVRAVESDARLILTLPPQSIAEQQMLGTALKVNDRRSAVLSLPAQLAFRIPQGTLITLSNEGLLDAMQSAELIRAAFEGDASNTVLEIPWGLYIAVTGQFGRIFLRHSSARPDIRSAVPVWHTVLSGSSDPLARDAILVVHPIKAVEAEAPSLPALTLEERRQIVLHARQAAPSASKLELSSLGGSLIAEADWSDFSWNHVVVHGRDQWVRTVKQGVLYPFGHRASLVKLVQRRITAVPHSSPVVPPHPAPPQPAPPSGPRPLHPHPLPQEAPLIGEPSGSATPLADSSGVQIAAATSLLTATAGLEGEVELRILEPVKQMTGSPKARRAFPFDRVEIQGRSFNGLVDPGDQPRIIRLDTTNKPPCHIPVRCEQSGRAISFSLPMIFVPDFDTTNDQLLKDEWGSSGRVELKGVDVDLIRASEPVESDRHEVQSIQVAAERTANGFTPNIVEWEVDLSALRALFPDRSSRTTLIFARDYLELGSLSLPLLLPQPAGVDFSDRTNRAGGLAAPSFSADSISRTLGPVAKSAANGIDATALAEFSNTTVLGLPLSTLIDLTVDASGRMPPAILPLEASGIAAGARMTWNLKLNSAAPFIAHEDTRLALEVSTGAANRLIKGTINNFDFELPPRPATLLLIHFEELQFLQTASGPPQLKIGGITVGFDGELKLLQGLATAIQDLLKSPLIAADPNGIRATYSLMLPAASSGMFVLRNISVNLGVIVPFRKGPVLASIGFGRRDAPFSLTVLGLGGGGYIDVQFGGEGLAGLEAALEFGALVEINFFVARAEVHAFGGVYFSKTANGLIFAAYIRIGGSVGIFGLVSISIELLVKLQYDPNLNRLSGRASIVVEVDLTLYSDTITLDSGEWIFEGPDSLPVPVASQPIPLAGGDAETTILDTLSARASGKREWQRYLGAFA